MKLIRTPLIVIGIILVAVIVTVSFNSHWVRIETVQIDLAPDSQENLLFERIRASLMKQMRAYEGKYFWQVPLRQVLEITNKDRRVKAASIFREFPSKLRVQIEPHTPILAYLSSDGRVYPVAADATLLPAQSITEAQDLPFLRGDDFKDEPSLREKTIELLALMPMTGVVSRASVSEIVYTKKEGFKLFLNGQRSEIKLGDTDFGPKLSRAQKVLSYLDARNIKGRVIDARFSKKVVVRVRNTP